jgi:hypothetical protein
VSRRRRNPDDDDFDIEGFVDEFMEKDARRSSMHPLGKPFDLGQAEVEILSTGLGDVTLYYRVKNKKGDIVATSSTTLPSRNTAEGKYLLGKGLGSVFTFVVSFSPKKAKGAPWQTVQAAMLADEEYATLLDQVIYGDEPPGRKEFVVNSRHVYLDLLGPMAIAKAIERAGKHLGFKVEDWFD